MPGLGGVSTGGGGGGGSATISAVDPVNLLADCDSGFDSIGETVASKTLSTFFGPRNVYAVFPAGWAGGNLTFSGKRGGVVQTETLTGTPGTTQTGAKIFDSDTLTVTNTAPAGAGVDAASIGYGRRIGSMQFPVTAFVGISDLTAVYAISSSSTTDGWIDAGVLVVGIYALQYRYTVTTS